MTPRCSDSTPTAEHGLDVLHELQTRHAMIDREVERSADRLGDVGRVDSVEIEPRRRECQEYLSLGLRRHHEHVCRDARQNGFVRVSIIGFNLPGREFCRPDGSLMSNVHVGVQLRREPVDLARADGAEVRWDIDIDVVDCDGDLDFRGPVAQGRRGDRFVYLTWGELHPDAGFEMFRRAKLMLNRIDPGLVRAALEADGLVGRVDLTGSDGGPRCARVDPPAILWSALSG